MATKNEDRPTREWSEVVACVDAFRAVMLEKLKKNQHKGNREGWRGDSPFALLRRVREEADELEAELRNLVAAPLDKDAEVRARILREAADVANMAMMVADAALALDVPTSLPPSPCCETAAREMRARCAAACDAEAKEWREDAESAAARREWSRASSAFDYAVSAANCATEVRSLPLSTPVPK